MSESLELLYWKDVKDKVISLNPAFGKAMAEVKHIDEFRVIKARYPFGAHITKSGVFHLPINNELTPFNDSGFPEEIRAHLDYNWECIPLSLVSENSLEWNVSLPNYHIPRKLFPTGTLLSLLTVFEDSNSSRFIPSTHSIYSGSKSLILLPKIAHAAYNERLVKKFKIKRQNLCPKTLYDQWALFHDIVSSKRFEHSWSTELIIFPKRFMQAIEEHDNIKSTLLAEVWTKYSYLRNQHSFDIIWNLFVEENLSLAQKNTPFITETAKHMLKVAMGDAPAYMPTVDESSAPISGLIDTFLEVYKIRYYLPIFMHTAFYDGKSPIYYSLHKHIFYHPMPEKSNANQTIKEISNIQQILILFKEQALAGKLKFDIKYSQLYRTLNETEFDFFHPAGKEVRSDILSIPAEDDRFLRAVSRHTIDKELEFPDHSIFFNGCIRIRPKASNT